VVGLLVAAGIDPTFSTIFVQSHIPAHAELAWILECETPMAWLRRMTQFKEKAEDEGASVSAGLFNYPDLMAADILLYDTDAVPVGDDQVQHLELTRDVAQRFNSLYGETFVIPRVIVAETGARVMGLDDATKKMSKSTDVPGHAIYLLDPETEIRAKISRATTDSSREIRFEETRPAIANLLSIFKAFTGTGRPEIEAHFAGKGYAVLKKELAEVVITALRPLQERYREVTAQPGWVDKILDEGEARVRPIAERTLARVKDRMGLG
jgi:tryptophanyl-tRNA synthetase